MSRSSWKPIFIHNSFFEQKKILKTNADVTLNNRATQITKQMLGTKINIYNGIKFFALNISNDMLGQKLGEFAPTRKKHIPPKKKIKK